MHVRIIPGSTTDKARSDCYRYLLRKYRKEKLDGRDLRASKHRGTSKKRLQP